MIKFEYARCESSEWIEGALKVQPDALGEDGSNDGAESMQPLGLFARPDDPSSEGGAGALVGRHGDQTFLAPQTDLRNIGTVPQGPKGSATLYAPKTKLTSYLHLDGGAVEGRGFQQLLIKYGSGAGKSLSITLDTRTADAENIQIRHGNGHGILLSGDDKVFINSANGAVSIELNNDKIVLNGNVQVNGGLMLGGPSGQPVWTTTDGDILKAAIETKFAAAKDSLQSPIVAPPLVAVTPGSSKVSAAL